MKDDAEKRLERVRTRIRNCERTAEEDREKLEALDRKLIHDSVQGYRQAQVLSYMHRIAKRRDAHGVSLQATLESQDDVEKLLRWIEGGKYEDGDQTHEWGKSTKGHYRRCLRKFGRVLNNGELPSTMEIVYGGNNRKLGETAPKRWEVLRWNDDVVPLLEACKNPRNPAIIAVAWDTGARPYELRDLTFEDLSTDGDFLTIVIGGKDTPLREVRLVVSAPLLKYWLEKCHPANDTAEGLSPGTPLWTRLDKNKSLCSNGFSSIPSRVAKRIDFQKPSNLRHFRKSRASVLASREEIGRGDLEQWLGWDKGSPVVAVYIKRFGKSAADKIAKSDGLPKEDLPESDHKELADPAPVQCPTCSHWTPRYTNECIWCATTFDSSSAVEAEPAVKSQAEEKIEEEKKKQVRRDVIKLVSENELSADDIETAKQLSEVIEKYPDLLDHADTLQDLLNDDDKDEDDEDDDSGATPACITN